MTFIKPSRKCLTERRAANDTSWHANRAWHLQIGQINWRRRTSLSPYLVTVSINEKLGEDEFATCRLLEAVDTIEAADRMVDQSLEFWMDDITEVIDFELRPDSTFPLPVISQRVVSLSDSESLNQIRLNFSVLDLRGIDDPIGQILRNGIPGSSSLLLANFFLEEARINAE